MAALRPTMGKLFFSEEKAEACPAEPKDFHSSASGKIQAMAYQWQAAGKQKSFASFLQKRRFFLNSLMSSATEERTTTMSEKVSAEEVARFGALAPRWWDEAGPMRPLHQMNRLRVGWISERVRGQIAASACILDLGCGGGIATEALARENFAVTGMDASAEAIGVARAHAAVAGLDIRYKIGLADDARAAGLSFDAVTALEIIEHVPDQAAFMQSLASLLRPRGLLFVSTINRTIRSLAVAKIGAEYVVRLLPAGTHDWRKFVKPEELGALGRAAGLRLTDLSGMVYSPAAATWSASRDVSINYIAAFARD